MSSYDIDAPGFLDYVRARSGYVIIVTDATREICDPAAVFTLERWRDIAARHGLTQSVTGYQYTPAELDSHHAVHICTRRKLAAAWDCLRLGLRNFNKRCEEVAAGLGPSEMPDPAHAARNFAKYMPDAVPELVLVPERDGVPPAPTVENNRHGAGQPVGEPGGVPDPVTVEPYFFEYDGPIAGSYFADRLEPLRRVQVCAAEGRRFAVGECSYFGAELIGFEAVELLDRDQFERLYGQSAAAVAATMAGPCPPGTEGCECGEVGPCGEYRREHSAGYYFGQTISTQFGEMVIGQPLEVRKGEARQAWKQASLF